MHFRSRRGRERELESAWPGRTGLPGCAQHAPIDERIVQPEKRRQKRPDGRKASALLRGLLDRRRLPGFCRGVGHRGPFWLLRRLLDFGVVRPLGASACRGQCHDQPPISGGRTPTPAQTKPISPGGARSASTSSGTRITGSVCASANFHASSAPSSKHKYLRARRSRQVSGRASAATHRCACRSAPKAGCCPDPAHVLPLALRRRLSWEVSDAPSIPPPEPPPDPVP
jgi:hypothetical protein